MEEKHILKDFGGHIRKLRQLQNLSQEKLAAESGLDRSYIGSVERGERNISLINIYKISKALNIPISKLFDWSSNDTKN